jgi:hypothetical protein
MVQRTVAQMVGADSERNQADADNGRVAAITLSHDTMKHITTLVTASIVAIVTLLKTVFPNPEVIWLGFVSIVSLIGASVCAIFTISGLVFYRGLMAAPATDPSAVTEILLTVFRPGIMLFAQLLCLGFFVMGLFVFAGFSIVNLWP